MSRNPFQTVLSHFRKFALSEHDKGDKFERLIQDYLQTDPRYADLFTNVWLWSDFHARRDFGGKDTGIDLVARTTSGDYWAIQCKCFREEAIMDKPAVDTFLSTSSKNFKDDQLRTVGFAHRLWISTTNHWNVNAETTIRNQHPPVTRLGCTTSKTRRLIGKNCIKVYPAKPPAPRRNRRCRTRWLPLPPRTNISKPPHAANSGLACLNRCTGHPETV